MKQTYFFEKSKEELINDKIQILACITYTELQNVIKSFMNDNISEIESIQVFKIKGELIVKVINYNNQDISIKPEKESNQASKTFFQGPKNKRGGSK